MTKEPEMQDIHNTDWDYLIVLDACRYDYFKENYSDFLKGDLSKKKSRGAATPEWLWKTFTSRYRYNYISANPYINSAGLSLNQLVSGVNEKWDARQKFQNIVNSWAEDWDDELGTVHPEDLTDTALEITGFSKTVVHYIQPHRPYISGNDGEHSWAPKAEIEGQEKSLKRKIFDKTRFLWSPFFKNLPFRVRSEIKTVLGMGNSFEKLVREEGADQVREYYTQDLRLALAEIARFIEHIDGKVVVTADHGELLGENNEWGHYIEGKESELLEVPWLKVKGVK